VGGTKKNAVPEEIASWANRPTPNFLRKIKERGLGGGKKVESGREPLGK